MMSDPLFLTGTIGSVTLSNRILRAGTSESMADLRSGAVTEPLLELYERLSANGVGGIITGHLYVDDRGKYAPGQTGMHHDEILGGLRELTSRVHRHGGAIFAQLAHAGSQSRVPGNTPVAPSPIPNPLTGAEVSGASESDISQAISAFGRAAERAVRVGFDGVHIHGANGYLINEFSSPVTNRREDAWGGDEVRRHAFPKAVVDAVRAAVPDGYPVMMKMGLVDATPDGLEIEESVRRTAVLVDAGLDAVEVSCGLMMAPTDSANTYVGVGPRRAAADLLPHRLLASPRPEAYFRSFGRAVRERVDTTVILVGGLRTPSMMRDVITSGDADFVALARPFIREPDLVQQIRDGRERSVDCTSCNLCLIHEGHHSLRCWRTPKTRLLQHVAYRITGGFSRAGVIATKQ